SHRSCNRRLAARLMFLKNERSIRLAVGPVMTLRGVLPAVSIGCATKQSVLTHRVSLRSLDGRFGSHTMFGRSDAGGVTPVLVRDTALTMSYGRPLCTNAPRFVCQPPSSAPA